MSTCCWCTPGGVSTIDFLQRYASRIHSSEFQTANEDLCYCLECVAEYHKARDELPHLHEILWELETLRLINHFEKSMTAEMGDDDVYIVDNNGEAQLFDFTGQDFENKLRVPLLEILKYPYLLLHERVNELCVEALCRMEQANCSFQVFDKHPGIYLFLVHPNEMVRRWAILTARNLGKVDRDDYYDLQEVLTCLFKVIELGLLESPDIYTSSVLEKGKLILLPSHMYDTTNYKNYWLGICMLLTILEEQAMDSLLLGSDKQNDFMQSILHTMERQSDDDSVDPFWPALHCFMVILDRLGSKVWGQLIDPIEAFQTIINNTSYNKEIQNIRNSSVRAKLEPESYFDDMVTCSQIVYNYNPEKTKKDSGWRSAICTDYCPNMYEEMETLASVLQSDIGQDMRVHNSTFLWFIPFVQSLMDLKDLGVAYIVEVIHHLHSEVKDVLNQPDAMCDKVTEFFLLILISVIELHRNKKCLHLLWVSSQQWVEAVVKCAKLPTSAFARSSEKSSGNCSKGMGMISSLSLHSMPSNSVQLACVQLIRSLLKEGYQLGQQTLCKRFWDKLNLFLRGNLSLGWQLTSQETHELQACLKQIIRNIKFKVPQSSTFMDLSPLCKTPLVSCKEESELLGKKSKKDMNSPTFSKQPMKAETHQLQASILSKANNEQNHIKDLELDHLSAEPCLKQRSKNITERAQDQMKVAQEWISSPNKEKFHQLQLRKFPADYKKYWEFVVYLEECELAKQLHPKENDLVFLVPERLNEEKKDLQRNFVLDPHEYHCGYVHKFRRTSVMRNGKSECSVSIQTQDNLPVSLSEFVKCIVISSLVTTQRKLKAMSLLSGRNQLARAVLNPNPMDFCTKDLLTTTSERIIAYLRDFNEDQKKAIETAYAMVRHSPSVAKICLIHGPPGTGKSKTIVGLLYRLLTERRGHSDENSNAKIKQNRVLVCAPSNAAVDELMKKIILEFKEKCKDKKNPLGNCGDINLVRLGPEKSINNEVLKFSLDSQVNHRMKKELPSHVQEMHRRKEYLDRQLDELSRRRALCRGGREVQRQELDEKIAEVSKERQELASKIKEVQGRPQKTQSIIILESHIICCTLSTSGGLLLESAFRGQGGVPFSCVIVDEAGQSCEVETLTPLIHRCNKLILVGDPKQLPPTVISMKAQEYGYDQSMMARFYKLLEENVEHNMVGRLPVLQLTVQYRMHPDICLFPSNYVYNRNLKTNRLTETNRCSSDWPFQPYLVFDVGDGSERRDNDSYVNVQEIKLVMELIKLIKDKRRDVTFRNIGIITHYKAQKTMIQKDLDKEFDRKGPAEVDTVDAFQGRQKDCVIVTCVRANAMQGSIGFLASLQRLNVTITRAKYSLFILGHLRTLMENQHWNHLIQDAQKRGAIIKTCDKNYRHDAMKILKLKPMLQRSLTHPPAVSPEASRPQGGLPSSKLDSEFAKTSFTSSVYLSPSDSKEATVTAKDPERPSIQDRLRDPRLLRRFGLIPEAKEQCLWEPQPPSPQPPGAAPPSGEPGSPGSHQGPAGTGQQSAAKGAAPSNHRPHAQCDPPAASADAHTSKRKCDQEEGLSHRRETRAFSEGDQERCGSGSHHPKRNSGLDERGLEKEDSSLKRRRLL
ncbi:probable helicase senataxin isoform X3 [Vicugna pacos]|uniref:Probable helicase senataxin isoform X3 n=1 Tax=Vicugna pacos TaxID=30538 RepID=A0ABM5D6C0_VICPA